MTSTRPTPQEQPRRFDQIPQHVRDTFNARRPPGLPGECWPWPCKAGQYGQIRWRDDRGWVVNVKAHRAAWMIAHEADIPAGMFVLHQCDNPSCCNPEHLRIGSHQENMRDAIERGRMGNQHTRPRRPIFTAMETPR